MQIFFINDNLKMNLKLWKDVMYVTFLLKEK